MSDEFIVCDGCGRHIREAEARCPFCAATARAPRLAAARAAAAACLAVAAGLSLQACYGGPPRPRAYVHEEHRPGGASLQPASEPTYAAGPASPAAQSKPEP